MFSIILLTIFVFLSLGGIVYAALSFKTIKSILYAALACAVLLLFYVTVLVKVTDRVKNQRCVEVSPYSGRCITWVRK